MFLGRDNFEVGNILRPNILRKIQISLHSFMVVENFINFRLFRFDKIKNQAIT